MFFGTQSLSEEELPSDSSEESEGVESQWDDSDDSDYRLPKSRMKSAPKKKPRQRSGTPARRTSQEEEESGLEKEECGLGR